MWDRGAPSLDAEVLALTHQSSGVSSSVGASSFGVAKSPSSVAAEADDAREALPSARFPISRGHTDSGLLAIVLPMIVARSFFQSIKRPRHVRDRSSPACGRDAKQECDEQSTQRRLTRHTTDSIERTARPPSGL